MERAENPAYLFRKKVLAINGKHLACLHQASFELSQFSNQIGGLTQPMRFLPQLCSTLGLHQGRERRACGFHAGAQAKSSKRCRTDQCSCAKLADFLSLGRHSALLEKRDGSLSLFGMIHDGSGVSVEERRGLMDLF